LSPDLLQWRALPARVLPAAPGRARLRPRAHPRGHRVRRALQEARRLRPRRVSEGSLGHRPRHPGDRPRRVREGRRALHPRAVVASNPEAARSAGWSPRADAAGGRYAGGAAVDFGLGRPGRGAPADRHARGTGGGGGGDGGEAGEKGAGVGAGSGGKAGSEPGDKGCGDSESTIPPPLSPPARKPSPFSATRSAASPLTVTGINSIPRKI